MTQEERYKEDLAQAERLRQLEDKQKQKRFLRRQAITDTKIAIRSIKKWVKGCVMK